MTTTTRYAAIDRHSGYVWGETAAEDALTAAATILRESDASAERTVEECSRYDAEASLDLYEVPAALVIEDGQDAATIAAVEAGDYVLTVRTRRVEEV